MRLKRKLLKIFDMKFQKLKTKSTDNKPSPLAYAYLQHERENGTLEDFLMQFEFDSEDEIFAAIRTLIYSVVGDKFLSSKKVHDEDVYAMCLWKRFREIATHASTMDKYPKKIAGAMWNGYFSRHNLDERTEWLLKKKPNDKVFAESWVEIRECYELSDIDMEKIHFFVEQVKAGVEFPDSLRRMLYIWGDTKKTGKTTCARMITCILNGDTNWENSSKYSSTLQNEMQVGSFKVPLIASCNAVMMDECFFADMGKMYADFKRFLTTRNGKARLPYGDEFEWFGMPNYIATSNDSLQKFIKDWNDRRYLSIEFKKPQMDGMNFGAIYAMWLKFICNSSRKKEWQAWANDMYTYSNEIGERQVYANEYEQEMRQNDFCKYILNKDYNGFARLSNNNRVTRKFFVDYFAQNNPEARQRKGEIESAAVRVFGEKYSGTNFWLLNDLRDIATQIIGENNSHDSTGYENGKMNDEQEVF